MDLDTQARVIKSWALEITRHADELVELQLRWRRGNMSLGYLPTPALDFDIEQGLKELITVEQWGRVAAADYKVSWAQLDEESRADLRKRAADVAADLWQLCVEWTDRKGPVIDWQLVLVGEDGEQLTSRGVRCRSAGVDGLGREDARPDETSEGWQQLWDEQRKAHASELARMRAELDQKNKELADARAERQKADALVSDNVKELAAVSGLVRDASRTNAEWQRELADAERARSGASEELIHSAYVEREKTRRAAHWSSAMGDAVSAAAAVVLPIVRVFAPGSGGVRNLPVFDTLQDCAAYIAAAVSDQAFALAIAEAFGDAADLSPMDLRKLLQTIGELTDEGQAAGIFRDGRFERLFRARSWVESIDDACRVASTCAIGRLVMFRPRR